ncbi:MAG: ATP-binding protein [Kiritimatiellaeota bacterium]|nr:ATP-binding protein [Kiritimatiellota bacterium]
MKMIARDSYLSRLDGLRDRNVIKAITGVRRAGKSTVMRMYGERLAASGVGTGQIVFMNFEDVENAKWLNDYRGAYHDIIGRLDLSKPCYVFLDEVQNVGEFERLVDGLHVKPNVDVYVTGSNAWLLSSELGTLLTGRYISLHILPLSFAELVSAFQEMERTGTLFRRFLEYGGMPGIVGFPEDDAVNYLADIFESIVQKDIMTRRRWHRENHFDRVSRFLYDSVGLPLSASKIATTLQNAGVKVSHHTIGNYLDAMVDAFLFYRVQRYDVRGKSILSTQEKFYTADIGFKRAVIGKTMLSDMGRNVENTVYLELLRRNARVFVGKADASEIDFVVQTRSGLTEYYQVAFTAKETATLERELRPLRALNDNYRKFLLTTDGFDGNEHGIEVRDIERWLLKKEEV